MPTAPPPLAETIDYVSRRAARQYASWVDVEDVTQELWLYALGAGATSLAKWAKAGESRRIFLTLFGAATRYCATEKAERSGYKFDDIAWYRPERIASMLPMAMDPGFDGLTTGDPDENIKTAKFGPEGGNLLAQVFDVRAALRARPAAAHILSFAEPDSDEERGALEVLSEFLGGDYPNAPGYARSRRPVGRNVDAQRLVGSEQ